MSDRPSVRERVLVVDDDTQVAAVLDRILQREGYRCTVAHDSTSAREWLGRAPYDLLFCDVHLPDGSGLDLVESSVKDYEPMAALMVSGIDEVALAQHALEVGAYGYVLKPFTTNEVLIAVLGALRHRRTEFGARHEARAAQEEIIDRLCIAIEARDPDAAPHITRTSELSLFVARELGLAPAHCALIHASTPMHDVGLVATPDDVVLKPGPLTRSERAVMERHAEIGYRFLAGSPGELLQVAATIAWTHHERVDGRGYPRGLGGDDIPIEGRIVKAADVFDALTRDRVYRPRHSREDALQLMRDGSGTEFDGDVLTALFAVEARMAHADETPLDVGASAPMLTPRERQVLQLAADGRPAAQIATSLTLSPATVKTHFQNIYAKLGTHDRASAVAEALRRGMIG